MVPSSPTRRKCTRSSAPASLGQRGPQLRSGSAWDTRHPGAQTQRSHWVKSVLRVDWCLARHHSRPPPGRGPRVPCFSHARPGLTLAAGGETDSRQCPPLAAKELFHPLLLKTFLHCGSPGQPLSGPESLGGP